ncbi:MAG: phosphatidate cytidylyltransferase, partial [Syntrophomonadaceae bacterium]|nr:phosphatidate cytidylyltransferase [Syntrophomonadaceae bacterium]
MLKTRVLSAIIGVAALLVILSMGGVYWQGLFVILGLIALYEYYKMMANVSHKTIAFPGYLLLLLFMCSAIYPIYLSSGLLLVIAIIVIYAVFAYPKISIVDIALSLFGPAYIGFLLSYAIKISELEPAFTIILLAFILTWSSDIGGYAFGTRWGKHKMVPLLSPGKSWEGAGGALLLTICMAFLFLQVFELKIENYAYVLVLAVL